MVGFLEATSLAAPKLSRPNLSLGVPGGEPSSRHAAGLPTCTQIARRRCAELAATNELRSTIREVSPVRSLIEPPASRTHGARAPMSHGFISGSIAASSAPRHNNAY